MINQSLSKIINDFFKAVEAKDLNAVLDYFHIEAELLDPHYPNVHMKGHDEIRDGLTWGFNSVKKFNFTEENYFENENNSSAAVEMATKIELSGGKKLSYTQFFILETKQGKIIRCQAYETYGPHGMHNISLKISRLIKKLTHFYPGKINY